MIRIATILILAFLLRLYGVNWDQGFHLHPDERQLIFVADKIHFFDNLNPAFFNYGTLPIYLLKGLTEAFDSLLGTNVANYNGMLYVGRALSLGVDLLTIYLIYKIALWLFKKERLALLSCFLYSISFFTIQNSHFFIVDTFLTFFTTALFYLLLFYLNQPRLRTILLLGIVFATSLTTKITAIIWLPILALVVIAKNINPGRLNLKQFNSAVTSLTLFITVVLSFGFLFMPYAFLDHSKFIADVLAQIKLNSDPYVFPYTLQYVYTLPYLYSLSNIFLWGLGPIIGVLSVIGLYYIVKELLLKRQSPNLLFFLAFYLYYFLIIGKSAAKFMRYMLPIYPFLAIIAGYGLWSAITKIPILFPPGKGAVKPAQPLKTKIVYQVLGIIILISAFLWTLAFLNIYSHPHTRISSSEWINQNVAAGSTLAVEHWDDRLPLFAQEKYNFVELTLYDQPDDANKWQVMEQKLKSADYIILASNRLFVPLQKLADCNKYKVCYPETARYYRQLFDGSLGFGKVAEFVVYPSLQIGSWKWQINDQTSDESFTVYDHPKVIIFKKNK